MGLRLVKRALLGAGSTLVVGALVVSSTGSPGTSGTAMDAASRSDDTAAAVTDSTEIAWQRAARAAAAAAAVERESTTTTEAALARKAAARERAAAKRRADAAALAAFAAQAADAASNDTSSDASSASDADGSSSESGASGSSATDGTAPATAATEPAPVPPSPPTTQAPSGPTRVTLSGLQARGLKLINNSRAKRGLPALVAMSDAQAKAQKHAEHLAATGGLEHSNLASGIDDGWKSLGENVARDASVDKAHAKLMAEPGHCANILSPRFNQVGVGVAVEPDGEVVVVQVFVER